MRSTKHRMIFLILAGGAAIPGSAWARKNNPPAGRTGSPASFGADCTVCHDGPIGSGFVHISGAPSIYRPLELYDLTIRIEDSAQVGAGFQISAETGAGVHAGSFIITDATNTQSNGNFVNHTGTGVDNSFTNWSGLGNAAEYQVRWQAPANNVGMVTFWAAGNAVDHSNAPDGDTVYLTNTTSQYGSSIPTVSAWGLGTLVSLLLCAGTIRLQHTRSAARVRCSPGRFSMPASAKLRRRTKR